MNTEKIITVTLIILGAVGFILFLMWKNNKDKKILNPDADDAVEESKMNHFHDKDSI